MSFDPFNDSVQELRDLIVKGKLLLHELNQRGFASVESYRQLEELCEDMEDILDLLKQMMRAIDEDGGKVHGKIFSANEIVARQNTLRSLEFDVKEISGFYNQVRQRRALSAAASAQQVSARPVTDEFLTAQEFVQREEILQQDDVMDRLAFGLQELRETGVRINDELHTQEVVLDEMDREVSGVQARLRDANAKVDKLLASMSNTKKVCTIVTLIFVLIFLAFFAFN